MRCVIIANCCVIIGIRAKSFTKVNSCRPHPQCLALSILTHLRGCAKIYHFDTAPFVKNASLAEAGGFEPPVRKNPYVSLANWWFQPLTHTSLCVQRTCLVRLCKDRAFFRITKIFRAFLFKKNNVTFVRLSNGLLHAGQYGWQTDMPMPPVSCVSGVCR